MVAWTDVAFVVLVVVPVIIGSREIPARLRDLRAGLWGVAYVPLLWLVLFPVAAMSFWVASYVPVLQWGWLGANIIVEPLADAGGGGGGSGGGSSGPSLMAVVLVPIIALAFLLFNYYEEQPLYRDSYRGVAFWALLHLVMGVPIAALAPLGAMGCGFKWIYDRHGQAVAYAAHFGSNMGVLALIVAVVVVGP